MNIGQEWNFSYTGDIQTFIVPVTGTYLLECWGAEGVNARGAELNNPSEDRPGGAGGYAKGAIYLTKGQPLKIYVGGKSSNHTGGWNGGGGHTGDIEGSAGGGGGTDIRTNEDDLSSRIIVAGGGGGAAAQSPGGDGGGLSGEAGKAIKNSQDYWGRPGTQSGGGAAVGDGDGGILGIGGNGYNASGWNSSGGGGGGYYGGGGGGGNAASGGGGSSYIALLSDADTISGVNTGHGKVKITLIEFFNYTFLKQLTFDLEVSSFRTIKIPILVAKLHWNTDTMTIYEVMVDQDDQFLLSNNLLHQGFILPSLVFGKLQYLAGVITDDTLNQIIQIDDWRGHAGAKSWYMAGELHEKEDIIDIEEMLYDSSLQIDDYRRHFGAILNGLLAGAHGRYTPYIIWWM